MTTLTNYRSVLVIKVPADSKWEPKMAVQIISGLYATNVPFSLVIRANASTIKWQIEIAHFHATTVKNIVQAAIPRAEVEEFRKGQIDKGFYLYQFEGAIPFIGNIKNAVDSHQDPLFSFVGNLQGLDTGEEVVYELVCGMPTQDYLALGNRMLTTSNINWKEVKSIGAALNAASAKDAGTDRVQAFENDIEKPARQKLSMPLREVNALIKIKASNKVRTDALFNRLITGFAPFNSYGNELVSGRQGYPLVFSSAEIASLWHLPTDEIKTQGVEWTTGIYAPLPPALMNASKHNSVFLGTSKSHGKEYPVYLSYPDRNNHLNIVGGSGVGKSTFMHNLVHQDIANGHGVAVLDPHGDLVQAILRCSIPESRIKDVVLVDLDDREYPVGLNFLAPQTGLSTQSAASHILAVFRKIFAEQWNPTRMENLLFNVLAVLMNYPGATILDIEEMLFDPDFRNKVTRNITDPVVKKYWLRDYPSMSESERDSAARPITSRLSKFYRDELVLPS